MLAHRSLGTSMFLQGELARSRDITQHGLALYDFDQHRGLAFRHGHDPGVALRAYLAWAQWILGNPDQALATCLDGLAHAQRLGHPLSLAFAMCFCAVIRNHRGEYARARDLASVAIEICTEHKLALWLAWATMARGLAVGLSDDGRAGAEELTLGLDRWRATGARSGLTVFPITLAEVHCRNGQYEEARRVLDEAREVVRQNDEHFYEAELLRLDGEVLHATEPGTDGAERALRRAHAIARDQGARSWTLRVATSLAELLAARAAIDEARAVLSEARAALTEAPDAVDARRADAVLAELVG
jgi:pentatricopeptide repeat protein